MNQHNREFLDLLLSVSNEELIFEKLLINSDRSWSIKKVFKYGSFDIDCYKQYFLIDHPPYEQIGFFDASGSSFSLLCGNIKLDIQNLDKINDNVDFFNYTLLYPETIFTLKDIINIKRIASFIKENVYEKWDEY